MKADWPEKDYRLVIKKTFDEVEKIYAVNDPDILEVEPGLGTITLMNRRAKIILSTQPSVRQLWLAAAHLGKAIHFDYDLQAQKWFDDKEHKVELFQYLEGSVKDLISKA
jgi:frataxin-like iron-binding protein CyaY